MRAERSSFISGLWSCYTLLHASFATQTWRCKPNPKTSKCNAFVERSGCLSRVEKVLLKTPCALFPSQNKRHFTAKYTALLLNCHKGDHILSVRLLHRKLLATNMWVASRFSQMPRRTFVQQLPFSTQSESAFGWSGKENYHQPPLSANKRNLMPKSPQTHWF